MSPNPPALLRPMVVTATYNERENVEQLIPALLALDARLRVIVVDDASPDGTATSVERLAARHAGRVVLIRRAGKLGYGSAFVAGFSRALAEGADAVVSMDADLSHAPASVPALLAALEQADLAIGSRYKDGVRILNWGLGRLLLSVFANRYVNAILGLGVSDCTSGFRAYRADALREIDVGSVRSNGYSFLVEVLARAKRSGCRTIEVPIVYEDRQSGESKMDRWVILEAAFRPWLLRLRRPRTTRRAARAP